MTLTHKILLGAAAVLLTGAASFPSEVAGFYRDAYPADAQKRAALQLCHDINPNFIRFLESDRSACYSRLKDMKQLSANFAR